MLNCCTSQRSQGVLDTSLELASMTRSCTQYFSWRLRRTLWSHQAAFSETSLSPSWRFPSHASHLNIRRECVLPGVLPAHVWSSSDASCDAPQNILLPQLMCHVWYFCRPQNSPTKQSNCQLPIKISCCLGALRANTLVASCAREL